MDYLNLSQIVKSGNIKPTDVTLTGTLSPKEGRVFANNIVKKDSFLSKITVDITNKLTKERKGVSIKKGSLTRHISGEDSKKGQKNGTFGCKLDMTKGVELFAAINDDTLADNQDNPNFAKTQQEAFSTTFNNDLQYLGFVGKDDSEEADAVFEDLAKGWVYNAKSSDKTIKVANKGEIIENLKALVLAFPEDIRGRAVIVMGATDYDEYQFELANRYKNAALLLKADAKTFMGYPIEVVNDMPKGTLMGTVLKNFVLGLATQVKRNRWYDNLRDALMYKFVVFPDYEFDDYEMVVILEDTATVNPTTTLTITASNKTVGVGKTVQATVQEAHGGISDVSVASNDTDKVSVNYNTSTGVIEFTGVSEGKTDVMVSDGVNTKTIKVTVVA